MIRLSLWRRAFALLSIEYGGAARTVRFADFMSNTQSSVAQDGVIDLEKRAFREGVRAYAPTMPGIFAWGMVTGMAMMKSGLTIWQALGMTFIVFAGSAQLACL